MFLINKVLMFKSADDAAEWIRYLYKRYPDTKYLTKSGEKKYFFHIFSLSVSEYFQSEGDFLSKRVNVVPGAEL